VRGLQAQLRSGALPLSKSTRHHPQSAPSTAPRPPSPDGEADPLRIVEADFLAGAGPGSSLPAPTQAEIAFAGRSNVGKSSLINTLVSRRSLVRVSSTPGSTRQLNLYEARAADGTTLHLVDLPGYGFTRRSKAERAQWATLIEGYLATRSTLAAVVVIVDVRRGLEDDDRELIAFIHAAQPPSRRPVQVLVVATKLDKEPRSARKTALCRLEDKASHKVLGFSSVTGEGRPELWRALRRAALGAPAAGGPDNVGPTLPLGADHDGGDPQTPGPADRDGGDPQTPGSADHDGGDPQTPGSADHDGGDPQTPGSADQNG
jgi:GTP-binding protein